MKKILATLLFTLSAIALQEAQAAKYHQHGTAQTRAGTRGRNTGPRALQQQQARLNTTTAAYQQQAAQDAVVEVELAATIAKTSRDRQLQVMALSIAVASLAVYYTTAHPEWLTQLATQSQELLAAPTEELFVQVWQAVIANDSLRPIIAKALALLNSTATS